MHCLFPFFVVYERMTILAIIVYPLHNENIPCFSIPNR